jgi:hypothetical protein
MWAVGNPVPSQQRGDNDFIVILGSTLRPLFQDLSSTPGFFFRRDEMMKQNNLKKKLACRNGML